MISQTVQNLIQSAFLEIAAFTPALPPGASDLAWGLDLFNRLIENAHNDSRLPYSETNQTFTLTPGLQIHTIGPAANTPTFVTTQRPIGLRDVNLVMTDVTPNVFVPIKVIPRKRWSNEIPVRNISSNIPIYLYYETTWPVGSIELWPIPALAYGLEFWERSSVFFNGSDSGGKWLLTDTISFPAGYADWFTLKVAKRLTSSYPGSAMSQDSKDELRELTQELFNTAIEIPELDLNGAGVPGGSEAETFNYRSRTF